MIEVAFIIEEDNDGWFIASAIGESIITQAETIDELKVLIIDALHCHFDER